MALFPTTGTAPDNVFRSVPGCRNGMPPTATPGMWPWSDTCRKAAWSKNGGRAAARSALCFNLYVLGNIIDIISLPGPVERAGIQPGQSLEGPKCCRLWLFGRLAFFAGRCGRRPP